MPQPWFKYKPFYILLFFLILSFLIMTFCGTSTAYRSFLESAILEVIRPFHKIASWAVNRVSQIWDGYIWLIGVRKENRKLKKRVVDLEAINERFREIEMENQRLKGLLDFRNTLPIAIISAQIIGKDATSWFQSMLLDKGTKDGVRVNYPVVIPEGLVGKVVKATFSTALVELITDKNSRVSAMIQKNRAKAILCGQSSPICTLEYLDRDADVQIGDYVISSGMGGIFPKGLMLGVVSKLEKKSYGLFQYAEVTPRVQFSMLEEVLILKTEVEAAIPKGLQD